MSSSISDILRAGSPIVEGPTELPTAKEWTQLIEDCCQVNPDLRPSFDQIQIFLERAARRSYPLNFFKDLRSIFIEAQIKAQIQSLGKELALSIIQDDEKKQRLRRTTTRVRKLTSGNPVPLGTPPQEKRNPLPLPPLPPLPSSSSSASSIPHSRSKSSTLSLSRSLSIGIQSTSKKNHPKKLHVPL